MIHGTVDGILAPYNLQCIYLYVRYWVNRQSQCALSSSEVEVNLKSCAVGGAQLQRRRFHKWKRFVWLQSRVTVLHILHPLGVLLIYDTAIDRCFIKWAHGKCSPRAAKENQKWPLKLVTVARLRLAGSLHLIIIRARCYWASSCHLSQLLLRGICCSVLCQISNLIVFKTKKTR